MKHTFCTWDQRFPFYLVIFIYSLTKSARKGLSQSKPFIESNFEKKNTFIIIGLMLLIQQDPV